jgi:hypothetical protein
MNNNKIIGYNIGTIKSNERGINMVGITTTAIIILAKIMQFCFYR